MSIIYLQKDACPFDYKEISEERGKLLCDPRHLCRELMLDRAVLAKHERFDHGLLRLPIEVILNYLLPYCAGDCIRVIFLTSIQYATGEVKNEEDTIFTFFQTTNLKDVCQYIGRQTSRAPHSLNVGIVVGDTVVHLSPYEEKVSIPKRCKIFIWKTHAFPVKECKCPFKGSGKCECHVQEYDWSPWIEKYRWL